MIIAKQSTARTVIVGPVLDADGVAVTDGVVGDFKISKNGGAPAALNGSATLTHRNTGHYSLALTTSDLDTVGQAEIVIDDTTNACPVKEITVVEEAVYDALFAASAPGYLQPTTAGRTLDVSAGGEAGVDWANVGSPTTGLNLSGTTVGGVASGGITRASFAAETGLQSVRSNTAQSGTAGSITLDASASSTDDFYKGLWVYVTGGTGAGQVRYITGYNGTSKAAAVAPNWATNPNNTSTFVLLPVGGVDIQSLKASETFAANLQTMAEDYDANTFDVSNVGGNVAGDVIGNVGGNLLGDVIGNVGGGVLGNVGGVAADGITASSIATDAVAEIADGVWDEAQSGHTTAGTFGKYLDAQVSTVGGGSLSVADIAEAVAGIGLRHRKVYYASSAGNDANDGFTVDTPKTLKGCIAAAVAGDAIFHLPESSVQRLDYYWDGAANQSAPGFGNINLSAGVSLYATPGTVTFSSFRALDTTNNSQTSRGVIVVCGTGTTVQGITVWPRASEPGAVCIWSRASNTVTVTHTDHGFATGMSVTVSGSAPTNIDGDYVITVTGANSYTFASVGADVPAAAGTFRFADFDIYQASIGNSNANDAVFATNVVIRDCRTRGTYASDALYFDVASSTLRQLVRVENCEFVAGWDCLYTSNSTQTFIVRNCRLESYGRAPVDSTYSRVGRLGNALIVLDNCHAIYSGGSTTKHGLDIGGGTLVLLNGSTITRSGDSTGTDVHASAASTVRLAGAYVDPDRISNGSGTTRYQNADLSTLDDGRTESVNARTFFSDAAAAVRAAVGLATANLDTQLGDIPTVAEFVARSLAAADYATATALADVPTVAEFNARTLPAADYATAVQANAIAAYLDTEIVAIKAVTDVLAPLIANGAFTEEALANAPTGGGGGGGTGDTLVNHDTGGVDNLRAVDVNTGNGIGNVEVRAYLKCEYDANATTATIRGRATTGDDGRWTSPMFLTGGEQYTLVFFEPDSYQASTREVTP